MTRKPGGKVRAGGEDRLLLPTGLAARLLGLPVHPAFDRLVSEGVFVPAVRGEGRTPNRFDGPALVAAFVAWRERRAGALDLKAERAQLVRIQREQAELSLGERRSEFRKTEDVEAEWLEIIDSIREGMLGVAPTAVQRGLIAPTQEAALDEVVRDALRAAGSRREE